MNLSECSPEGIQLLTGIMLIWVIGLGGLIAYGLLHEPFMSMIGWCRKLVVGGRGDRYKTEHLGDCWYLLQRRFLGGWGKCYVYSGGSGSDGYGAGYHPVRFWDLLQGFDRNEMRSKVKYNSEWRATRAAGRLNRRESTVKDEEFKEWGYTHEPQGGNMKTCTRCLFSESVPDITFDADGVCSYCTLYDEMSEKWPGGVVGHAKFTKMVREIRRIGKSKKYDCIVGVSGGCDSSYMLYRLVKDYGMRPLAVHFDNGWNSRVAEKNLKQITERLGVDVETVTVDHSEFMSMQRAFLEAGSVDIETPSDIGLAAALYQVAHKHGIKYIFEGHNFRTEGSWPLGWLYMDQRYINSVCKEFGCWPLHKSFPRMGMKDMFHWMGWHGIKKIRPWYYWDTNKEKVIKFLEKEFGWKWYGGHHLENKATAVYHSWFMPGRFNLDTRINGFSALIRSGQMTREGALEMMKKPPYLYPLAENNYVHELGYSKAEFGRILMLPRKTFRDFKTYKKWFEFLRPLFWLLSVFDRIPFTFVEKYCAKDRGEWNPELEAAQREHEIMYANITQCSSNPETEAEARDNG